MAYTPYPIVPGTGGGGGGGPISHASTTGRSDPNGHPIAAITGLEDALTAAGGGAGLLAVATYNPGSATGYTTTTSWADVDATNVKVTFVAPASGNVLVDVSAIVIIAGTNYMFLSLRDGSSNVATSGYIAGSVNVAVRLNVKFHVTGLTPGQSYTYKLGASATSVSGGAPIIGWGGDRGAVVMSVMAAP